MLKLVPFVGATDALWQLASGHLGPLLSERAKGRPYTSEALPQTDETWYDTYDIATPRIFWGLHALIDGSMTSATGGV